MIKYFLYPHKLLRLQVCIFSADSIKEEFNTSGRNGLNCVTLSSEDVFVTQLWPRDTQYPHHFPFTVAMYWFPKFQGVWGITSVLESQQDAAQGTEVS